MEQALFIRAQIKRENRIAANWLTNYRERKRVFEEQRKEIETGKKEHDDNIGGSRSSIPSKPVERVACNLDEHDQSNTAKWLQAVDDVRSILGPKKRQLLGLRQECKFYISPDGGRPGWIAPVQQRFGEITGWCPAENKIKEMWYDIVSLAVRIAHFYQCKF